MDTFERRKKRTARCSGSRRGIGLVEVSVAVGLVTVILFGISMIIVNQLRVQRMIHIGEANNQVVQIETHRLRNLPLTCFYTDSSLTTLRAPLTYYRILPMPPGPKGELSQALYAEITVALAQIAPTSGSPVTVTLTVRPVRHRSGAISSSSGVAPVGPEEFTQDVQNLKIKNISQVVTFVAL